MPSVTITQTDSKLNLEGRKTIYNWIKAVIISEKKQPGKISIVLCSDNVLLGMNNQFLGHNYFTDIITFDYSEGLLISGELYISVERTRDNAKKFKVKHQQEIHRVMAHGVLHLCGYTDKSERDQRRMRLKEDEKLLMLEI